MDHTLYKWCFSKHVFHTIYVCVCSFDIGQEISLSVACLIMLPPSEVAAAPFYYLCSFWVCPASGGGTGGRSTLFIALPPLPLLYTANMQMGLCSRRGRGQGKGREGRGGEWAATSTSTSTSSPLSRGSTVPPTLLTFLCTAAMMVT